MPLEELFAIEGYLYGPNGLVIPQESTFTVGETFLDTVGKYSPVAKVGPRVPETSMDNYSGSLTSMTNGSSLQRLIVPGIFKPSVQTFRLIDSKVTGGVPPGSSPTSKDLWWPMFDVRSSQNVDIQIEHCEAAPSFMSHEIYGAKGGNFTVYRSWIHHTVDGIDGHGSGTWPNVTNKKIRVIATLIEALQTFTDPNQSDNITHNDGGQFKGALDLVEVFGCVIYGGRTSVLLFQQQVGTYRKIWVHKNWLYGHPTLGSTMNTSQNGKGVLCAAGDVSLGEGFIVEYNRISKAGNTPFGGATGHCPISPSTIASPKTFWTENRYMEDNTLVPMTSGSD